MLTSLFGDLGTARAAAAAPPGEGGSVPALAAVPIVPGAETEADEPVGGIDRHLHDLVVSGSPARALREYFDALRGDLETASRIITLLDPVGMWASAVIRALADAGGRPIERLHLREHGSLRTLAVVERTTLARRYEETLTLYHADVRAPGRENAEIPVALMERSHMTTVIVGPPQPRAIDALLASLREATVLPTWRCPNLLFILPPDSAWMAIKVGAVAWPAWLQVHLLTESLSSASAVWNAMLGMWNHVKDEPGPQPRAASAAGPDAGEAFDVERSDPTRPTRLDFVNTEPFVVAPVAAVPAAPRLPPQASQAREALTPLLDLDGLLGCALVDVATGMALASVALAALPSPDMGRVADSSAQVFRAERNAARGLGFAELPDETVIGAGGRRIVIHALARYPGLLLVTLLDRAVGDLVRCRRKLGEVEARLG